jgi:hypothetical protein
MGIHSLLTRIALSGSPLERLYSVRFPEICILGRLDTVAVAQHCCTMGAGVT